MIQYTINDNNLHLIDSYKCSKKNFSIELNNIKNESPNSNVWKRKISQMCLEWGTHNFCYMFGIEKERTKDCDLNYPQSFWIRAIYAIVGVLTWIFIK